jgi:hypothetical protein
MAKRYTGETTAKSNKGSKNRYALSHCQGFSHISRFIRGTDCFRCTSQRTLVFYYQSYNVQRHLQFCPLQEHHRFRALSYYLGFATCEQYATKPSRCGIYLTANLRFFIVRATITLILNTNGSIIMQTL